MIEGLISLILSIFFPVLILVLLLLCVCESVSLFEVSLLLFECDVYDRGCECAM